MKINSKKRWNSFQIISLGFACIILLGTLLLMLPVSGAEGHVTPFLDSLFTAASAVCVTGLVRYDTASYWSGFGQGVILLLIQTGGMGVITTAAALAMISGKKISLMQRSTIQEAIAAPQVGGIVRLTGFIIRMTFLFELSGAIVMAPVFCRDFGLKGLWMALFHSISAFCNAGFDLMGTKEAYSSLTAYAADPLINISIMLLIIIGGIGFLTWDDIRVNHFHIRRYRMQSKVILGMMLLLVFVPAVYFFFLEYASLPFPERILTSLFQSVTARTAGFNTADLTGMSEAGTMIMIVLMMIGGSPGSTAGGMKTTTIAVLFAVCIAAFGRKEHATLFKRRIDADVIKNAASILLLYITLFLAGSVTISIIEDLPLLTCFFETASAIATVGLTLGITQQIGAVSQIILILLMFFGRVGGLTLIFAALSGTPKKVSTYPQERITVG